MEPAPALSKVKAEGSFKVWRKVWKRSEETTIRFLPAKVAPTLPRPPTQSRLPPPTSAPASKPKPLYVWFENEWFEIDKEEFVIGRGAKFSDLAIKDANISRRHCSVVRRGHDYFIKDLGSTNGIEFEGQRVDNHKIIDGSVYFLCDHEIRFTFTPPNRT